MLYEQQMKYSKYLSSLFCAVTIVGLSILCLLNSLTIDLYSMFFLLKVVLPASICNWFLGFVVGKILDTSNAKRIYKKIMEEKQVYEIPSIFSADAPQMTDDLNFDINLEDNMFENTNTESNSEE